jgi:exodeoxyribonuclease-1
LLPDLIPSPGAAITHRIGVYDTEGGMTEVDAARHIHALMNKPGTVSIGYNTLGFDDEFLRFTFFRNLLDPYTHQYANGCGRMDLLPFSVIYYLHKNEIIKWPEVNGKASLKLELISSLNSLAEGQAHDAMVDVEATLALARIFFREKETWHYLKGYFDKKTDAQRINSLPVSFQSATGMHLSGIMTGTQFGADLSYQIPVIYVGESVPYKGQGLWLRLDQEELPATREDNISGTTWVIRKKNGEPGIVLPPIPRFIKTMKKESLETAKRNVAWLKENDNLFRKIVAYYRNYTYPVVEGVDADASIYLNGFLSGKDKKLCGSFHNAAGKEKEAIANQFDDKVTVELAERIIARNFNPSGELGIKRIKLEKNIFGDNTENTIIDFRGDFKKKADEVLLEIAELRNQEGLCAEQISLLEELEAYIEEKRASHENSEG